MVNFSFKEYRFWDGWEEQPVTTHFEVEQTPHHIFQRSTSYTENETLELEKLQNLTSKFLNVKCCTNNPEKLKQVINEVVNCRDIEADHENHAEPTQKPVDPSKHVQTGESEDTDSLQECDDEPPPEPDPVSDRDKGYPRKAATTPIQTLVSLLILALHYCIYCFMQTPTLLLLVLSTFGKVSAQPSFHCDSINLHGKDQEIDWSNENVNETDTNPLHPNNGAQGVEGHEHESLPHSIEENNDPPLIAYGPLLFIVYTASILLNILFRNFFMSWLLRCLMDRCNGETGENRQSDDSRGDEQDTVSHAYWRRNRNRRVTPSNGTNQNVTAVSNITSGRGAVSRGNRCSRWPSTVIDSARSHLFNLNADNVLNEKVDDASVTVVYPETSYHRDYTRETEPVNSNATLKSVIPLLHRLTQKLIPDVQDYKLHIRRGFDPVSQKHIKQALEEMSDEELRSETIGREGKVFVATILQSEADPPEHVVYYRQPIRENSADFTGGVSRGNSNFSDMR